MGKRAVEHSDRAIRGGRGEAASPTTRQVHLGAPPAPAALLAVAEELGRLMARRLLTSSDYRKGYSLPKSLIGLTFNAVMLLLAYYLIAWLRR